MIKRLNKIEKLIAELCPEGVEFRELGEVVKIFRGKRLTKNQLSDDEKYPVYHGGLEPLGNYGQSNRSANTVMVINVGASAGTVGYSSIDFWSSDGCFCIGQSDLLINRYVYYALLCHENILRSKVRVAGIPTLDTNVVESIKIPIPPLAIQQDIVKILDTFIKLEAELEAELEARKKQYEYYRAEILTFGKNIEWKTLEQVAEFKYGFTDRAKAVGNVRLIRITDIDENGKLRINDSMFLNLTEENKEYLLLQSDILMARTGATYGKTMLFNENYPAVYASFLIRIRFKGKNILPSFYWHFAQSRFFWDQAKKLVGGGAQPQFNANVLKGIKIPIPPLAEQERIVAILDKFDALVNDISVGLPAELKARRKQYEYYREKLLTFKEK